MQDRNLTQFLRIVYNDNLESTQIYTDALHMGQQFGIPPVEGETAEAYLKRMILVKAKTIQKKELLKVMINYNEQHKENGEQ